MLSAESGPWRDAANTLVTILTISNKLISTAHCSVLDIVNIILTTSKGTGNSAAAASFLFACGSETNLPLFDLGAEQAHNIEKQRCEAQIQSERFFLGQLLMPIPLKFLWW